MADHANLGSELAALQGLPLDGLRVAWRRRFKREPPVHASKDLLVRAYAYELQARADKRPKKSVEARLETLAQRFAADRKHRPTAESSPLKAGSVLVREWNGQRHVVTVAATGFIYEGQPYRSLSVIACAITGAKWSGPRFFQLTKLQEAQ